MGISQSTTLFVRTGCAVREVFATGTPEEPVLHIDLGEDVAADVTLFGSPDAIRAWCATLVEAANKAEHDAAVGDLPVKRYSTQAEVVRPNEDRAAHYAGMAVISGGLGS